MKYTYEVQNYQCPTCNRYAEIPTSVSKDPFKCVACDVVICNWCQKYMYCPRCSSFLTVDEDKRFEKIEKLIRTKQTRSLFIGLFALVFIMVIVGGIFMSDIWWILVGSIILAAGLGYAIYSHLKSKKMIEGYIYEREQLKPIIIERMKSISYPIKKCSNCDKKVNVNNTFCDGCGTKF